MDPDNAFNTLFANVVNERAGAPTQTECEEWPDVLHEQPVDQKTAWLAAQRSMRESECIWIDRCREDEQLLELAWLQVAIRRNISINSLGLTTAINGQLVPVSPHYYDCPKCGGCHAINVVNRQLTLVCDGELDCGCFGYCQCRNNSGIAIVNGGRGSILTCGDVESNPGPDSPLEQVLEAIRSINVHVNVTPNSPMVPTVPKARLRRRKKNNNPRSKGNGTLMTCGDVESNPGPEAVVKVQVPRKKKKKQSKNKLKTKLSIPLEVPAQGQIQIMGRDMVAKTNNRVANKRAQTMTAASQLPEYSQGFLIRHLDPCGEYRTALDYGKCPDGTLPQSVSGQFREVFTIRAPGVAENTVPLDGRMWSLAIISPPLWRVCQILVADMNKAEVGDEAISAANRYLNMFGDTYARHPTWAQTKTDGVYVSVVRWKALIDAPEPSQLGVSPLISDFRITGEGFTVSHNTPSLIDQGIAVVAQFNPNVEQRTLSLNVDDGITKAHLAVLVQVGTNSTWQGSAIVPGIANEHFLANFTLVNPAIGQTTNSEVLGTPSADFTVDGTTIYTAGQQIRVRATRTAANAGTIALQRNTGTAWEDVPSPVEPLPLVIGGTTNDWLGLLGDVYETNLKANVVTVPPVTQEDLIQQTPKTVQFLLKNSRGFYVVKRVWQPVLNMTRASSYGPVRLIDKDTTLDEVSALPPGIQDTFDANYGYAVCNLSSLPLACAPYVKVIRSWEAVPARGSSWGPFTTTTSPKEDSCMVIARTVADLDPFAYPHDYNGFGILFGKICSIIARIPRGLRTAANVADKVANICQSVQGICTDVSAARQARRETAREGVLG